MSAVLEVTPSGTKAAMISAVLGQKHQRMALPTIAGNFKVTLADLQTVLNAHGYPDNDRMAREAATLRAQAVEDADRADTDDSLTAVADVAAAAGPPRLVRVAVDNLHADPNNLREHVDAPLPEAEHDNNAAAGDIEQLADSIKEVGLLQPIVARRDGDRLVVVAGHRRLAAIRTLRWTHVEVIVRAPMRPDHVVAAMLIENGQRRDLDPIEEARGILKLKAQDDGEDDLTDLQVARKIGRSQSYVSMRLALLTLTPQQQEDIRRGALGITQGAHLGRLLSGNTRHSAKGHVTVAYFGATNDLSPKAAARCNRLGHKNKLAGGIACGACWESVIRAAERTTIEQRNATADRCVTCGTPLDHTAAVS